MAQTLNSTSTIIVRCLGSRFAHLIGIVVLVFALTVSGVAADESTADGGSGTPVGSDTQPSLDDQNQDTTGQTEVGSTEPTPIPTPTPSPTPTTTTEDDPTASPDTNLNNGTDTGTGADTGESAGATPDVEASPTVDTADEPVLHPLVVTVYNCETDPGDTPQSHPDCVVVEAAGVVVQVESVGVGDEPTDANGQASFDIEEGSTASVSQSAATISEGYTARGGGVVEVLVDGPSEAHLVNLADLLTQGRFQLSNQQCFTSGEPFTEFLPVIGPMVRAASADCVGPVPGVAKYTITGGSLAEPMEIDVEGGGWTGYLDPGDYSITRNRFLNGTDASTEFSIVIDQITVVLTVDYITGTKGTVSVQRFVCTEGDVSGVVITLYDGGGGGAPDESCSPSEVNVELYSVGGSSEPLVLDLNSDGTTVEVATGDYVLRDVSHPTPIEQALTVTGGGLIQALIVEIRLTGVVSAQINLCADPSSNFEDPTRSGYWSQNCGPVAPGTTVRLLDAAGNVVATTQTGSGGAVYFEDVLTGTYVLEIESSCALFANGGDARGGFTVAPHQVVTVAAYECAKPSHENPGGGNNGGEEPGGNQNGGSDSVGALPDQLLSVGDSSSGADPAQNPELFVTTLPAIGTGQAPSGGMWAAILMVAIIVGLAGIRLATPAKRTRPVRSRR